MTYKSIVLPPQPKGSEKVSITSDTSQKANTIEIVQTTVSTTAIRIAVPESAKQFMIRHVDPSVVLWIGKDSSITAAGTTAWPVKSDEVYSFEQFVTGNENALYGILASGSITVYCMGVFFEA